MGQAYSVKIPPNKQDDLNYCYYCGISKSRGGTIQVNVKGECAYMYRPKSFTEHIPQEHLKEVSRIFYQKFLKFYDLIFFLVF